MMKKAVFTALFMISILALSGCSEKSNRITENPDSNSIKSDSDIQWVSISQVFTENPPTGNKSYTFLYFTDDSCADGLFMDIHTFTDPAVVQVLNQKYNPARISTSEDSLVVFYDSTMSGNQLFKLYNLVGVPSFLILDSHNRYHRRIQAGFYSAEEFSQILLETSQ